MRSPALEMGYIEVSVPEAGYFAALCRRQAPLEPRSQTELRSAHEMPRLDARRKGPFEQVNGGDPGSNETSSHLHRSVIRAGDEFENRMNHLAALWHGCAE
jgi:hypothetical protein